MDFNRAYNMTYSRSKKLTETEKKLQSLRAQLYGKAQTPDKNLETVRSSSTFTFKSAQEPASQPSANTSYLRRDLIKIAVLALAAIGIELLLFLAIDQGILKI